VLLLLLLLLLLQTDLQRDVCICNTRCVYAGPKPHIG